MVLYRSPEYQTYFESVGLSVQEKQFKVHSQDDGCCGHLGFLIDFSYFFIYKLPRYFLPSSQQTNNIKMTPYQR